MAERRSYSIFGMAVITAVMAALVSCSKVEQVEMPAKPITFTVGKYVSTTRDGVEDLSSMRALNNETTTFKAKAFLHADGYENSVQDMFGTTGETITYNPSVPEWAPSHDYYWPKSSTSFINFAAWYTNINNLTNAQLNPSGISELQMNWGTSENPIQIDSADNILFADLAYNYKNNQSRFSTVSHVSDGVPVLFHHALAKIAFNIRLKTPSSTSRTVWDVVIDTASLTIANNGYLPLAIAASDTVSKVATNVPWKVGGSEATSAIVGWSRPGTGATYETILDSLNIHSGSKHFKNLSFSNFAPTTLTQNVYQSDSLVFLPERTVMPQVLDGNVVFGLSFRLYLFHAENGVKIGNAYSEEVITIAPTPLVDLVDDIPAWKMNTKYIYNITIDPVGKKVLFDPAVVDWTGETPDHAVIY